MNYLPYKGTVNEGICDGWTDEMTVAGTCHCKTYAGGDRCDRCIEGDAFFQRFKRRYLIY